MSSSTLTPMMQQYMETKEQYKDCILFYRLGDFYEMFFDDALTVTKELDITLTGKNCGLEERAPMCGVPYHAVEGYLTRLVQKGYKVAICEQVEDPKLAKGIVKREVVRIVTPGTNINTQALDETKNNYIMCIVYIADRYGLSVADVSTGDYFVTELDSGRKLLDEIAKFSPSEIICNESLYMSGLDLEDLKNRLGITIYSLDAWYFDDGMCTKVLKDHFKVSSLEGLGLTDYNCGLIAAGALLQYLYETQKTSLAHLTGIISYTTGKYMLLDSSSRRNLELCETLREKQKRGSLLWVLDKTKTAMGARTLRSFVEQPLIHREEVIKRLDAVGELKDDAISREEIREYLTPVYDLERLISKISYQSANPRDLIAFKSSISMLPYIKGLIKEFKSEEMQSIYENMDDLKKDVIDEIVKIFDREVLKSETDPLEYRDIGINYIRFAKEEPELFKLMFNNDMNEEAFDFINLFHSTNKIFETISKQTGMSNENAKQFHLRMWLYVNGIASLVAHQTVEFNDEEIVGLLKDQYVSMLLYEVKKGNVKQEILVQLIKKNRGNNDGKSNRSFTSYKRV